MIRITHLECKLLLFALTLSILSCKSELEPTTDLPINTAANKESIPEVEVITVTNENIHALIKLSGRLKALREIDVVSEVQGKVLPQKKELDAGTSFQKSETLIQIERTQTDLSLYATRAKFNTQIINLLSDLEADNPEVYPKWKDYTDSFDYTQLIPDLPSFTNSREKYLFNLSNIPGQYLDIKAQEELLTKYQLKAPFKGIITQSNIDFGDVVSPGKLIAKFMGTAVYEFETAVSERELTYLKMGSTLSLQNTNTGQVYQGRILRIGGIVDESTQTVPVYLSVTGQGLKQGIFLEGTVKGKLFEKVVTLSDNLITRNNEVYVVNKGAIEILPIERVGSSNGFSIVKGIPDGAQVVNQTISTSTMRTKVKAIPSSNNQTMTLK
ncbi:MAG: HlyD family efflux transporter periplasmic adaptor subunit [Bacteroidota bacterium]